jgi:hypothetical protein
MKNEGRQPRMNAIPPCVSGLCALRVFAVQIRFIIVADADSWYTRLEACLNRVKEFVFVEKPP